MEALRELWSAMPGLLPFILVLAALAGGLALADWLLLRRPKDLGHERQAPRQMLMLILTVIAVVMVVVALPVGESTRGQLLGLIGVLLTAIIALSSTTFVANTMAGIMMRIVRNFRPRDFVKVGDHFGRVTERGLFHTEIQTESRDLTTLPNLYLVSNPVSVIRSSGTIVSCSLSLGYDVPHQQVRPLLSEAATRAGLSDPFVRVLKLGDFSVTYRVSGFLSDVKTLLSKRSELRMRVLDTLHGAGIEVASPDIRLERVLPATEKLVPAVVGDDSDEPGDRAAEIMFDKAERAETVESLRQSAVDLRAKIEEWRVERKAASAEAAEALDRQVEGAAARAEKIDAQIARLEADKD